MIEKYLPQEGIAVHSFEDATALMQILLKNGNCVMVSREENLWIVNWVWSENDADRNDVIFTNRADYECDWWDFIKAHPEIQWKEDE